MDYTKSLEKMMDKVNSDKKLKLNAPNIKSDDLKVSLPTIDDESASVD